jgi:hypothetical protein
MDTTSEPSKAVEEFIKRAERLASGAEHDIPSWLRRDDPESRLPVLSALRQHHQRDGLLADRHHAAVAVGEDFDDCAGDARTDDAGLVIARAVNVLG